MGKPVIEVKGISKKYILTHRAMYETFRDQIMRFVKKPLRAVRREQTPQREEFWALRNVSFSVQAGERIGIIGRNGAGKSTLLKILSQITAPTTGEVLLHGKVASLLEVGTGFHPELTGRENIFLNGAILGMKQSEIRKKFDEIVDFAEIHQFLDTPVKRYSSGMYVRLAFAVAAHLEPEILIVDEVLAVGDMQFQKKCLGKMQAVAKSGRTVLFVSHNLAAIKQLCDTCILLTKGEVTAYGPAQDVITRYLEGQDATGSEFTQEANPNKKMNLRRVTLRTAERDAVSSVNFDEDIHIRIEYEVNTLLKNGVVWLYLQSLDGIMPFTTVDYDLHPELRERREPGYYTTELVIPKKLLNTGAYTVVVILNSINPVVEFDRVEAVRFDIIDNGTTPKSVFNESARGGVLQPYYDWHTKKVA